MPAEVALTSEFHVTIRCWRQIHSCFRLLTMLEVSIAECRGSAPRVFPTPIVYNILIEHTRHCMRVLSVPGLERCHGKIFGSVRPQGRHAVATGRQTGQW